MWTSLSLSISGVVLILSNSLYSVADAPQCYFNDGSLASSQYTPCNTNLPEGSYSACCSLGGTSPDICLSSGLCYSQNFQHPESGFIYANGCTDPTGKSEACQQVCTSKSEDFSDEYCDISVLVLAVAENGGTRN
jgi:hypothetical protein